LKMEKSERTMNAKPKLMAADAVRLSGFILITQIQTHYHWPEWFLRKGWGERKECQVWLYVAWMHAKEAKWMGMSVRNCLSLHEFY
jgi:hypothetical protein